MLCMADALQQLLSVTVSAQHTTAAVCAAVGRTVVMRRPFEFLRYALGSRSLVGKTFNTVVDSAVTMPEVRG